MEDNISGLCNEIVRFWEKKDQTISTIYNERLIEHWERINFAKKEFARSSVTAFKTDDRGRIYVRLGEPSAKEKGTLQFDNGLMRSWVGAVNDYQSRAPESRDSSGVSGDGESDAETGPGGPVTQHMQRVFEANAMIKEAMMYHRNPYYEIWVYRELNDSKHNNLIYIFGEDGDTGTFGLRKSLDEMIPSAAFRRQAHRQSLLTPGLLLQLAFYEQTKHVDGHFEDAFSDLQSRIMRRSSINRQTSMIVRSQNQDKIQHMQYRAPSDNSTEIKKVPNIDLNVYQYRMLDSNNNPYLGTYVESSPQLALLYNQVHESDFNNDIYNLSHLVKAYDSENNNLFRKGVTPKIPVSERGKATEMEEAKSYFKIPSFSGSINQIFSAELTNVNKDSVKIGNNNFPDNLDGIGNTSLTQPSALTTNPEVLQVSDLIIGVATQTDKSYPGPAKFEVAHDKSISNGKNLMIHFEVYHLNASSPSANRFKVEYKVNDQNRNFFERIFGGGNKVGLTLNFETMQDFFKTDLEVETSAFEPGKYELILKVIEPATSREISRSIIFTIEGTKQ